MSCVFSSARCSHAGLYPSKCMKCARILWELCFLRHQTGALGEIARHSKLKDVAIHEKCARALLSFVLCARSDIYVRRPSGNKDRICSTGTKCQFSYTHTRAARNTRVDFLLFFISFQTALLKEEGKAGLLILLVFMQSIKRSASKCWDTTRSFFCTQLPFLCNWLLNAHTQVFLSGNFSNKAFSKFITLLFMPKKASLCVRTGSLCRINISWN